MKTYHSSGSARCQSLRAHMIFANAIKLEHNVSTPPFVRARLYVTLLESHKCVSGMGVGLQNYSPPRKTLHEEYNICLYHWNV